MCLGLLCLLAAITAVVSTNSSVTRALDPTFFTDTSATETGDLINCPTTTPTQNAFDTAIDLSLSTFGFKPTFPKTSSPHHLGHSHIRNFNGLYTYFHDPNFRLETQTQTPKRSQQTKIINTTLAIYTPWELIPDMPFPCLLHP